MYWTDVDKRVIMRSYLNGSSEIVLLSEGLEQPGRIILWFLIPLVKFGQLHNSLDGIAVDWVNNKVYFTDARLNIVGVFDPVGFHYSVLARSDSSARPRAIVLDPSNR